MPFTSFKDKELIDEINFLRTSLHEGLKEFKDDERTSCVASMKVEHINYGIWIIEVRVMPCIKPTTLGFTLMLYLTINSSLTKGRLFWGEKIEDVHNYLLRSETTDEWIEKIRQSAYSIFEYSSPSRPPRR